jgi:hypothetical protein
MYKACVQSTNLLKGTYVSIHSVYSSHLYKVTLEDEGILFSRDKLSSCINMTTSCGHGRWEVAGRHALNCCVTFGPGLGMLL